MIMSVVLLFVSLLMTIFMTISIRNREWTWAGIQGWIGVVSLILAVLERQGL